MTWLMKTIAGAAITAVVGFFVTQYLQAQKGNPERRRAEQDRRFQEPRMNDRRGGDAFNDRRGGGGEGRRPER